MTNVVNSTRANDPPRAQVGFRLSTDFSRHATTKAYVNFTQEVHDFPNLTMPIGTAVSGAWLGQLGSITYISVFVPVGIEPDSRIRAERVVAGGIYRGQLSQPIPDALVRGAIFDYEAGTSEYRCGPVGMSDVGLFDPAVLILDELAIANRMAIAKPFITDDATDLSSPHPTTLSNRSANEMAITEDIRKRVSELGVQVNGFRHLRHGWDDEGAEEFGEETINTAEKLIELILTKSLFHSTVPAVVVGPLPDGSLRFEWTRDDKELFLTVCGDNIEVQTWQPLDSIECKGYWETDLAGADEHIEWLLI